MTSWLQGAWSPGATLQKFIEIPPGLPPGLKSLRMQAPGAAG
ncbi:hypothetical protein HMPREF9946_02008 [Acetobacteraceae bacterium AT-5844]|nr:hypothetical protein HMPREF9946_02008 [Acetobacteraceae bacterium AT-5844]